MELKDCIVFLLAKNSQAGYRFWGNYISKYNVTPVQAMVLILLNREDGVSAKVLGEHTQLDSATITGVLDRLEGMDLIIKKKNPADRRAILISLSEKGRHDSKILDELFEEAHNDFLSDLTTDEEFQLRDLLKRILEKHRYKLFAK